MEESSGRVGKKIEEWLLCGCCRREIHVTKYDNEIYDYDVINGATLKPER